MVLPRPVKTPSALDSACALPLREMLIGLPRRTSSSGTLNDETSTSIVHRDRLLMDWVRCHQTSILQRIGFINREELHNSSLGEIARSPDAEVGFFKMDKLFVNTNLPPSHVYELWSM
ncbi:hypothetical protein HD806DRAFT_512941 [Xylariaceae sp. AK1471]|nr:hypothetical protein HD806DRAFT_512941 [Xylariaceae sp. AK1471]